MWMEFNLFENKVTVVLDRNLKEDVATIKKSYMSL